MSLEQVAEAWGWRADQVAPLAGGLINKTYVISEGDARIAVLQQLHPIFGAAVNLDIEAVTTHLASRGLPTPRLIRTLAGNAWVDHVGHVWRALTYVEGETVHRVPSVEWATAGGALVGRFHRAIADLQYDYKFTRSGVHDTSRHLSKLQGALEAGGDVEAMELGREVLRAARGLPVLPDAPKRHVHGDLKISNLIFQREPLAGVCLVDLDTFAKGTMAFELGDAMRSWCNPHGEDAGSVRFDLSIFHAAIAGFRAEANDLLTTEERVSIVTGLETVCIELAARFAVDVFEDRYFGWDAERFPSRRAHNLVRARGQLQLGLQVRSARGEALAAVSG
ncbi:MAG TPA: aminoglycoside phosphotransferase family protein [Kofleriaceae bacterium]|nr:aminoglycoside phosphotransferase family protein [Kofleriaceae bacterium]